MTKRELDNYKKLQNTFQTRCETVCRILTPLKDAYYYVDEFEIDGDDVCGRGEKTWQYGGYEKYYAKFPKEYIYMDDKEIQKIVDAELKKRYEAKAHKKEIDEHMKAEKEKTEYERLKKIYG